MAKSLLFIPDISGFTQFVQSTEVEHSTHVIAELLEVLIKANTIDLKLAEIEGDALFFYKENEIVFQEQLLAQVDKMFTAFYSHLKLLEKNRICPCNACATAPNLQLKIIAHCGELQFITVQNNRKPFGKQVIEVHRLLKNHINSDNYVLISEDLAKEISMPMDYQSRFFQFEQGKNTYDNQEIKYTYAIIETDKLQLSQFPNASKVQLKNPPNLVTEQQLPLTPEAVFEVITNYAYRHHWMEGVKKFIYDENEVTRLDTEHVCVIGGFHFNFAAVTKEVQSNQLVYGEMSTDLPICDKLYHFYILTPLDEQSTKLTVETYWQSKSILKKGAMFLMGRRMLEKMLRANLDKLRLFLADRF